MHGTPEYMSWQDAMEKMYEEVRCIARYTKASIFGDLLVTEMLDRGAHPAEPQ